MRAALGAGFKAPLQGPPALPGQLGCDQRVVPLCDPCAGIYATHEGRSASLNCSTLTCP